MTNIDQPTDQPAGKPADRPTISSTGPDGSTINGRVPDTACPLGIRPARPDDMPAVLVVLAAALDDTDIARWLVPDPDERTAVYRRYFALVGPWFFTHPSATVYVTNDRSGTALWARLDGKFEPHIDDYDQRLADATGTAVDRFRTLDKAMHAAHPDNLRHDYLAFLAVAPHRQGRGIGSRLLKAHHAISDRDRVYGYLEATGLRNAALYNRYGYLGLGPLPIGDGPRLIQMQRRRSLGKN
jgi:GNAT superfamily N-acetyltransferase